MGHIKETMAKMRCTECKEINYYSSRNKKKVKEKLELNKYCKRCQKHTLHKEMK